GHAQVALHASPITARTAAVTRSTRSPATRTTAPSASGLPAKTTGARGAGRAGAEMWRQGGGVRGRASERGELACGGVRDARAEQHAGRERVEPAHPRRGGTVEHDAID